MMQITPVALFFLLDVGAYSSETALSPKYFNVLPRSLSSAISPINWSSILRQEFNAGRLQLSEGQLFEWGILATRPVLDKRFTLSSNKSGSSVFTPA